ncbi:MAG: hypothetical protein LC797_20270, partial [Chloroflexi bacterium]|nr:hypothetical protein [Chloroflexota bacterium]
LIVGAAGRAISAYLPAAELRRLGFARAELDLLHRVPVFGLACTVSDRLKDVWAAAAPIHDGDGGVHAALVVTGPICRWTPDLFARYGPSVRAAAHQVAQQLGYGGPLPVADSFDGLPVFGSGAARVPPGRAVQHPPLRDSSAPAERP